MKKISDSTIKRLSKYYRTLDELKANGTMMISSNDIALINSITSAQVRKDLSFFGTFGKRGLGYNTEQLHDQIGRILGLKKLWNVGLVGFGNIGNALLNYNEFKTQGFHIKAIFENDFSKCDSKVNGVKISHINQACEVSKKHNLEIMIVAVPAKYAQAVVDKFVECGIQAFLNFAPTHIKAPEGVLIKNENMSIELESLSFFLSNK